MANSLVERLKDTSLYLALVVFIATLGPLQFGYHLVSFTRFPATNNQHAVSSWPSRARQMLT